MKMIRSTLLLPLALGSLLLGHCSLLRADPVPGFWVTNATGTTSAQALVPALAGHRIEVTGLTATSDKSSAVLTLRTTTTSTDITIANTNTTAVTNVVSDNTGFAASDIALLQTAAGACYLATVSSVNNSTNIVLNSGGFGAAVAVGDKVGKLGSSITYPFCNCTASYQGGCLFVAPEGRAICALLDGTSACAINGLAVKYVR